MSGSLLAISEVDYFDTLKRLYSSGSALQKRKNLLEDHEVKKAVNKVDSTQRANKRKKTGEEENKPENKTREKKDNENNKKEEEEEEGDVWQVDDSSDNEKEQKKEEMELLATEPKDFGGRKYRVVVVPFDVNEECPVYNFFEEGDSQSSSSSQTEDEEGANVEEVVVEEEDRNEVLVPSSYDDTEEEEEHIVYDNFDRPQLSTRNRRSERVRTRDEKSDDYWIDRTHRDSSFFVTSEDEKELDGKTKKDKKKNKKKKKEEEDEDYDPDFISEEETGVRSVVKSRVERSNNEDMEVEVETTSGQDTDGGEAARAEVGGEGASKDELPKNALDGVPEDIAQRLTEKALSIMSEEQWERILLYQTLGNQTFFKPDFKPKACQLEGLLCMLERYASKENDRGNILADQMGLGKTLILLMFINCIKGLKNVFDGSPKAHCGASLLTVPLSVMSNYMNELDRHCIQKELKKVQQQAPSTPSSSGFQSPPRRPQTYTFEFNVDNKAVVKLNEKAKVEHGKNAVTYRPIKVVYITTGKQMVTKEDLMKADLVLITYGLLSKLYERTVIGKCIKSKSSPPDAYMSNFDDYGHNKRPLMTIESQDKAILKDKPALHIYGIEWDFFGLDEGHTVRNRDTQLYASVSYVSAWYRCAVTGTPAQNWIVDLFTLYRFIRAPEINNYTDEQLRMELQNMGKKSKASADMSLMKKRYMIRRFQADMAKTDETLELPKKYNWVYSTPLGEKEHKLYVLCRRGLMELLEWQQNDKNSAFSSNDKAKNTRRLKLFINKLLQESKNKEHPATNRSSQTTLDAVFSLGAQPYHCISSTTVTTTTTNNNNGFTNANIAGNDAQKSMYDTVIDPSSVNGGDGINNDVKPKNNEKNVDEGGGGGSGVVAGDKTAEDDDDDDNTQPPNNESEEKYGGEEEGEGEAEDEDDKCIKFFVSLLQGDVASGLDISKMIRSHTIRMRQMASMACVVMPGILTDPCYGTHCTKANNLVHLIRSRVIDKEGYDPRLISEDEEEVERFKEMRDKKIFKVIVYFEFVQPLMVVSRRLNQEGIRHLLLYGDLNMTARRAVMDSFTKDDSYKVLLASVKASETGWNGSRASRIIHWDPGYNPEQFKQADGRVHRTGVDRDFPVHSTRLLSRHTCDENVYFIRQTKAEEVATLDTEEWENIRKNNIKTLRDANYTRQLFIDPLERENNPLCSSSSSSSNPKSKSKSKNINSNLLSTFTKVGTSAASKAKIDAKEKVIDQEMELLKKEIKAQQKDKKKREQSNRIIDRQKAYAKKLMDHLQELVSKNDLRTVELALNAHLGSPKGGGGGSEEEKESEKTPVKRCYYALGLPVSLIYRKNSGLWMISTSSNLLKDPNPCVGCEFYTKMAPFETSAPRLLRLIDLRNATDDGPREFSRLVVDCPPEVGASKGEDSSSNDKTSYADALGWLGDYMEVHTDTKEWPKFPELLHALASSVKPTDRSEDRFRYPALDSIATPSKETHLVRFLELFNVLIKTYVEEKEEEEGQGERKKELPLHGVIFQRKSYSYVLMFSHDEHFEAKGIKRAMFTGLTEGEIRWLKTPVDDMFE